MPTITHWINGKPWEGTPARTGKVYDPATGEVQGEVAFATSEVVDAAVAAAQDAFRSLERDSGDSSPERHVRLPGTGGREPA